MGKKVDYKNIRIALVTGASSGIGREIAIRLAKDNIYTILTFNSSPEGARKTLRYIKDNKGRGEILHLQLSDKEEIKKFFFELGKSFSRLDILINNAGIYIPDLVENLSEDNWDKIMNINLRAKALCTKYAVPLLKKSANACIVNIASRAAEKPIEESSAYCCAANAITMLSKVSALELSKYKIRVNAVSPGLTKTPMTKIYDTQEDFKEYANNNPSHRIGTTKDIANVVSFLISDEAEFINAENINVSGGILLR